MSAVVCEASKLSSLIQHCDKCPSLRVIITMAEEVKDEERAAATKCGLRIHSMQEVKVGQCGRGLCGRGFQYITYLY